MKVYKAFPALAALISITAVSCTKDDLFGHKDNHIRAAVSASSIRTKSGLTGQSGRLVGSYALDGLGTDSLCIAVYEFDNSTLPQGLSHNTDLRTKGTVITNDGINQDNQMFRMDAWLESQNRFTGSAAQLSDGRVYEQADATDYHFMKNATATCDGTDWTLGCASSTNDNWDIWRNKVPTNFWAMYPVSLSNGTISSLTLPADNASDAAQKTLSFDYTLPTPSTDYTDAEKQQDLCFAYSRKAWDEDAAGNDNTVDIRFYHALSAVYFDISGVTPSAPVTSITVKQIGFKNVPSSAHCVMTGTLGDSNGNPGALLTENILWSDQSSLKDYKQVYLNTDFDTNSKVKFDGSKVFMMIPGTLNANAELWVEFEVDGSPVTKSVNISKYSNGTFVEWKPGKYYLYRLVFTGSGDLDLTGSIDPYLPDWF